MTDDGQLLRRYAETRSESAFAELVRRHLNLVYSAALRRTSGNPHRAEEISQQVFIAVARRAEALSRHPVLAGWLYAATRNASIDLLRSEQRRKVREQEAHTMQTLSSESAGAGDWARMAQLLGSDGYAQLQQYDRAVIPLEGFVAEISTLANSNSAALNADQTERLIDDIAGASGAYQGGGKADLRTVGWPQVMGQAQAYLSAPQLVAVKANSAATPIGNFLKQFFQQQNGSK